MIPIYSIFFSTFSKAQYIDQIPVKHFHFKNLTFNEKQIFPEFLEKQYLQNHPEAKIVRDTIIRSPYAQHVHYHIEINQVPIFRSNFIGEVYQ
ncbi:MAG: hypothetical protein D6707_09835, partial [Bacteroidetes bacterium]